MEGFWSALTDQAPGLAFGLAITILFLKAIEKRDQLMAERDKMFLSQMDKIVERMAGLETLWISHDKWEREVVGDIKTATRRPHRKVTR
ncbi:MAG: hypothetical protein EHM33_01065 [Chloroflexi bacterium]|nr:MAG: hypothetical protein EHM33_01065 [Chloroflexota bacterium]